MSMHSTVASCELTDRAEDRRAVGLRRMSAEQLRILGTRQVAYLRSFVDGEELGFVVYGADGIVLAVADTLESAVETAVARGLEFIAVH